MNTKDLNVIATALQTKNATHVTVTPYADDENRWEIETGATTQYLSVVDDDGQLNITLMTHNGVIVSYAKVCWVSNRLVQSIVAGLLGLED